jgi:hypothetical protein
MAQLIDTGLIADTFTTRLARIDKLGPCSRLVFAVPTSVPGEASANLDTVVAYIVVPTAALAAIAHALLTPDVPIDDAVPDRERAEMH